MQGVEQDQHDGGDGGRREAEDGGADAGAQPGGAGRQDGGEAERRGGGEASISSPRGFASRGGPHTVGGEVFLVGQICKLIVILFPSDCLDIMTPIILLSSQVILEAIEYIKTLQDKLEKK